VTRLRRRWALLRQEGGYTVMELLTVMGILGIVMGSLTTLMVSATSANQRMNLEFQAQTEARLAIDRIRREGHGACRADPVGPTTSITLSYVANGVCPALGASGAKQITWCTVANGANRYGLYRKVGTTCDATGVRVADYLTVGTAFDYQTTIDQRPTIGVLLAINPKPAKPESTYTLDGDVVLRNSPRTT
jgi:type II secretory pathway pseudopilin PulG